MIFQVVLSNVSNLFVTLKDTFLKPFVFGQGMQWPQKAKTFRVYWV